MVGRVENWKSCNVIFFFLVEILDAWDLGLKWNITLCHVKISSFFLSFFLQQTINTWFSLLSLVLYFATNENKQTFQ
jgi:hypothetical protein